MIALDRTYLIQCRRVIDSTTLEPYTSRSAIGGVTKSTEKLKSEIVSLLSIAP